MDTTNVQGAGQRAAPSEEVLEGLNDLLQLDHDALGAYEIAIQKLKDRDHADQINGFRRDHERHVRELSELIAELGGTPKNEPHATGPFKQALQSLGAMAGDRGVLMAWRTNELQVRTKYDAYASRALSWPQNVKRVIDRNALDEERHYRWVVDVLSGMGLGSGTVDSDASTAARERARAGMGADMSRITDTVRNRAADALKTGAHRLESMLDREGGDSGAPPQVEAAGHRLAGGMESTADYLRRADGGRMRADFERQVQESPVQTLLGCAAVGFVIGRILR